MQRFFANKFMKISELEAALAKMREEHGDLEVIIASDDGPYPLKSVALQNAWRGATDELGKDHIILEG